MKSKAFLALLAVIPLCGCKIIFEDVEYTYNNADQYVEYKEAVVIDNSDMSSIIINWVSGNITLVQKDEPLSFSEKDNNENYLPLYYRQFATGVEIEYIKSGTKSSDYSTTSKELEVVIPLTCKDIKINAVSANSVLHLQNVDELLIDTVSGGSDVEANQLKTTSFDSVSGNLKLTVADTSILSGIDIDSVSGDATLYVEPSRGYQLSFESVSGTVNKNFEKTDSNPYSISFDSVSGNLAINEKQ